MGKKDCVRCCEEGEKVEWEVIPRRDDRYRIIWTGEKGKGRGGQGGGGGGGKGASRKRGEGTSEKKIGGYRFEQEDKQTVKTG